MTEIGQERPSDDTALYVFAVCTDPEPAGVTGLPGVTDEWPVRTLPLGKLTAIVQSVRAAEFTDEVWQARLSDQSELERYARSHHAVVSAAAAACPTVPLPMATLYLGEERARHALNEEADRFRAALKRIAHHEEWGVKVYTPTGSPAQDTSNPQDRVPAPAGARPAPGEGLAYLRRKRGMQEKRERHLEDGLRVAETVDTELRGLAAAFRRLRPHGARLSVDQGVQVLNATYLVADHRADELESLAQELRVRTGAHIEISGPWVPYSFVGEV